MPLAFREESASGVLLGWSISESEHELSAMVSPADLAYAARFTNTGRRLQNLAWKAALRGEGYRAPIGYTSNGAPYLMPPDLYVPAFAERPDINDATVAGRCTIVRHGISAPDRGSVKSPDGLDCTRAAQQPGLLRSHHPARFLSTAHTDGFSLVYICGHPCGCDIELRDRNLDRVRSRFISPQEESISDGDPLFPLAVWCAKEAMYKWLSRTAVDFIGDLVVTSVNFDNSTIRAKACGIDVTLSVFVFADHIIVRTDIAQQ